MLIVAYKINEILVKNYEKDQSKCSATILIGALLTSLVGCFTFIIYSYKEFNCAKNQILVSVTLILVIVIFVLSVKKFREDASFLTASIATFYILYCQWNAFSSDPDEGCNKTISNRFLAILNVIIGVIITIIALFTMSS